MAERIGSVKTGVSKKSIYVKWDSHSGDVYVEWAGSKKVGRAKSASEAMRIAEAFLYDK